MSCPDCGITHKTERCGAPLSPAILKSQGRYYVGLALDGKHGFICLYLESDYGCSLLWARKYILAYVKPAHWKRWTEDVLAQLDHGTANELAAEVVEILQISKNKKVKVNVSRLRNYA